MTSYKKMVRGRKEGNQTRCHTGVSEDGGLDYEPRQTNRDEMLTRAKRPALLQWAKSPVGTVV